MDFEDVRINVEINVKKTKSEIKKCVINFILNSLLYFFFPVEKSKWAGIKKPGCSVWAKARVRAKLYRELIKLWW